MNLWLVFTFSWGTKLPLLRSWVMVRDMSYEWFGVQACVLFSFSVDLFHFSSGDHRALCRTWIWVPTWDWLAVLSSIQIIYFVVFFDWDLESICQGTVPYWVTYGIHLESTTYIYSSVTAIVVPDCNLSIFKLLNFHFSSFYVQGYNGFYHENIGNWILRLYLKISIKILREMRKTLTNNNIYFQVILLKENNI